MTTINQSKFLEALSAKLNEINGDGGVSYSYTYEWGKDKITFGPRGMDTKIKAQIMREAGYELDKSWEKEKQHIRDKSGIQVAKDTENRKLARLFNSILRKYLTKARKACLTLQDIQMRFCRTGQTISDPVRLIINDILPGFQRDSESEPNSDESV